MRARLFVSFALLTALATGWAPAETTDPAKIASFEKRFAQGKSLEEQGKLTEARIVFDGILAEEPTAKGSLREAGLISVRLNDMAKAEDYFEQLHTLVPDYPMAIESLIQINQSLKRDVKVEKLLKEFRQLRNGGKVPQPYFVRERIHLDGGIEIVMTQYFDYTQEPYTAWMMEVFDTGGNRKRWLLFTYDPDATKALRAKDPAQAKAEVFTLYEHVLKEGKVKEVDAYQQYSALPDYKKVRALLLATLTNTPKPIYSQAVDPAAQ